MDFNAAPQRGYSPGFLAFPRVDNDGIFLADRQINFLFRSILRARIAGLGGAVILRLPWWRCDDQMTVAGLFCCRRALRRLRGGKRWILRVLFSRRRGICSRLLRTRLACHYLCAEK